MKKEIACKLDQETIKGTIKSIRKIENAIDEYERENMIYIMFLIGLGIVLIFLTIRMFII